MMMRFLITDSYTIYNKGDAAIVIGMLKTLRKFYSDAEISILSATPKEDERYYSRYGAKTYSRLFNTSDIKNKNSKLISIKFFFKMISYLLWTRFDFFPINKK